MYNYTVFDAFTGVSPFEKLGILKFLESHTNQLKPLIQQSVDYAVKDCPSFGGYIFSANYEKEPIGVAVINKTGMPSYACKNLLVQFAIAPEYRTPDFTKVFFEKLLTLTNRDLALQLIPGDPNAELLKLIGFQPHKVEYRFVEAEEKAGAKPSRDTSRAKIEEAQRKRRESKLRIAS